MTKKDKMMSERIDLPAGYRVYENGKDLYHVKQGIVAEFYFRDEAQSFAAAMNKQAQECERLREALVKLIGDYDELVRSEFEGTSGLSAMRDRVNYAREAATEALESA